MNCLHPRRRHFSKWQAVKARWQFSRGFKSVNSGWGDHHRVKAGDPDGFPLQVDYQLLCAFAEIDKDTDQGLLLQSVLSEEVGP